MGKKHKHSKDKLYKTVAELSSHHSEPNRELELSVLHRRLKFDSCCLSLNAVNIKPMGLCDGENFCYVFECDSIVKFLEKYQVHPITGCKVNLSDLFELKLHKNNDDQYHCPVLYKLFNQHSKIVANKKTGNAYLYEAYYELNLRSNNFKDLLTDEPFDKDTDIVVLQDPALADTKWNVSEFFYVKNNLKLDEEQGNSSIRSIEESSVLKSSLEEYKSKAETIVSTFNRIVGQEGQLDARKEPRLDQINSAVYSDGTLSSSVTSTVAPSATNQRAAQLSNEQILYPRIKKKGYVQIVTNFGHINLELFCDRTPMTCHNFLLLVERNYYDNTIFHRLIKNFIIQGGDPTGTGSGGQSAWGEPFKDEFHADLRHEGKGVLSMANSGPNTNKSQFFITLKGVWDHLDGKHTIFGRVVGGLETLEKIESEVEVDKKDRPKEEVKIVRIIKYVDPFKEAEKHIEIQRKKLQIDQSKVSDSTVTGVGPTKPAKKFRSGVGTYIDTVEISHKTTSTSNKSTIDKESSVKTQEMRFATGLSNKLAELDKNQRKSGLKSYGDFSNW